MNRHLPLQPSDAIDSCCSNSRGVRNVEVSVVVPTHNRAYLLAKALESLIVQNLSDPIVAEVVVVDNASTDHTKKVIDEVTLRSPIPIRYIYEGKLGYPWALNRGVIESHGEWIAFYDDDQLAHPDLLSRLTAAAISNDADCVGGTIRLQCQQLQPQWLGPVCRNLLGEHVFEGEPAPCRGKVLPSGGNMMIARKVFDAIGLFDTSMSAGNDAEILFRARAAGFGVWVVPSAEVYHLVPDHRLRREYLRWVSLRWGSQFAQTDWKRTGWFKTSQLCIARLGQALLIRIPLLVLACLRNRKAEIFDTMCLLWRAWAYARRCLCLVFPRFFPQTSFFAFLDFNTQREFGPKL